jgi:hypothetical protein
MISMEAIWSAGVLVGPPRPLAIKAAALVTHDRDLSRVRSLRIIS